MFLRKLNRSQCCLCGNYWYIFIHWRFIRADHLTKVFFLCANHIHVVCQWTNELMMAMSCNCSLIPFSFVHICWLGCLMDKIKIWFVWCIFFVAPIFIACYIWKLVNVWTKNSSNYARTKSRSSNTSSHFSQFTRFIKHSSTEIRALWFNHFSSKWNQVVITFVSCFQFSSFQAWILIRKFQVENFLRIFPALI